MFACADGATMSAKKDGLGNIGGFLALRDGDLAGKPQERPHPQGGVPHLRRAWRDGTWRPWRRASRRSPTRPTSTARIGQVASASARPSGERASPSSNPRGAMRSTSTPRALFRTFPPESFPAQSLAVALYAEGGVRGVEIGSLMFGKKERPEFGLIQMSVGPDPNENLEKSIIEGCNCGRRGSTDNLSARKLYRTRYFPQGIGVNASPFAETIPGDSTRVF